MLETNIKDIYAIGDCAEQHEGINGRRPIEAVWYTGRMMGETLAQTFVEILQHTTQVTGLIAPSFSISNIKPMVGCLHNPEE